MNQVINTSKIKENLKFLIEIVLFYPIILQAISDISKNEDPYDLIFKWGVVIFSLIISYLLVDNFGQMMGDFEKSMANIFAITSIVSFAFQFYLLAVIQSVKNVSYFIVFLFGLSMSSSIVFPITALILIISSVLIRYFMKY